MKRLIALMICFALALSLFACGGSREADERLPKAFGIIKNGTALEKYARKNESAAFTRGDFESALGSPITYITVTELPDPADGVLMFRGAGIIKGQTVPAEQLNYLRFVPNAETESAGFGFSSDAANWKTAVRCVITLRDSDNLAPVGGDSEVFTVEGIACEGKLEYYDPDGDEVAVNVVSYPRNGSVEITSDGKLFYSPNEGFTGKDKLVYTVSDRFGAESGEVACSITVAENPSGIKFSDMLDDSAHLAAQQMCAADVMTYRYAAGEYVFEPETEVDRVDFLVMLMCAAGLADSVRAVADTVATDDAGLSSGLKGFIAAAADKGLIKLDSGAFRPRSAILMGEAAAMTAAALSIPAYKTANADGSDEITPVLSALRREGIIDPADDPAKPLTRRDCAVMLYRATEYLKTNVG